MLSVKKLLIQALCPVVLSLLLVGCGGKTYLGFGIGTHVRHAQPSTFASHHEVPQNAMQIAQAYFGMSQDDILVAESKRVVQHVALLLPLEGKLAGAGEAVRNGFIAAYQQDGAQGRGVTVKLYDTTQAPVTTLYHQAITEGADFVIGPLSKAAVFELANGVRFEVPTLALNDVQGLNAGIQSRLLQFGLSPHDEAVQVAQKAAAHQYRRAVIIAPDNRWGQNIADTFATQWEAFNGELVARLAFTNQKQVSQEIRDLLGVADSQTRAKTLQTVLGEKVRSVPRRRQDIDVIFLAAEPYQARQIRPLLKFYYGGDIPVYATSAIYGGHPKPTKDRDLDGIQFCDTPWVLQSPAQLSPTLRTLRQQLVTLWPESFTQYNRLYGFGIDAYRIMAQFNRLATGEGQGIQGASGRLYLAHDHHVYRQLDWAYMRHGVPKLLPNA